MKYRSYIWCFMVGLAFNIGTMSYAFVCNSMNDALSTLLIVFQIGEQYTSIAQGILTASVFVGAFFGTILAPQIQKIGERKCIYILDFLMILGSVLQTSDNLYIFLTGRFIAGIGGGLNSIFIGLFIRLFCPTQIYGDVAGLTSSVFSLGYLLTETYGLFFAETDGKSKADIDPYFWRIYFFSACIPCLIRMILMTFVFTFNAPSYYIKRNQDVKAKELLNKIYHTEYVDEIYEQIENNLSNKSQKNSLFKPPNRRRMIFGFYLHFLCQFCGFNAIVQYSTLIFTGATTEAIALDLTFLIAILKVILFTVTAQYTINKFGRRIPLLAGLVIMCIANLGMGMCSYLLRYSHSADQSELYNLLVCFTFMFIVGKPICQIFLLIQETSHQQVHQLQSTLQSQCQQGAFHIVISFSG